MGYNRAESQEERLWSFPVAENLWVHLAAMTYGYA